MFASRRILTLLFVLLLSALTLAQFCHNCEVMINDAKANFNNDFSQVTADQLYQFLQGECHKEFPQLEAECESILKGHETQVLNDLQAGQTAQQVCASASLC